jgi:hypothetical protein
MNMIGVLLLLSFAKFKVIALNSKLPEDLETLWLKKQVMIFHNSNPSQDLSIQQPDCFGMFLNKYNVLTAASCFVELNYMLQCNEKDRKHQGKQNIMNFESIKKSINIENTIIAKVSYVKYLPSVKWIIQFLLHNRLPQM